MKNEQQIFDEWKRANKKGLNEGFLDGDEEKPVTSDDSTGEENLEELSNEDEKNSAGRPRASRAWWDWGSCAARRAPSSDRSDRQPE